MVKTEHGQCSKGGLEYWIRKVGKNPEPRASQSRQHGINCVLEETSYQTVFITSFLWWAAYAALVTTGVWGLFWRKHMQTPILICFEKAAQCESEEHRFFFKAPKRCNTWCWSPYRQVKISRPSRAARRLRHERPTEERRIQRACFQWLHTPLKQFPAHRVTLNTCDELVQLILVLPGKFWVFLNILPTFISIVTVQM